MRHRFCGLLHFASAIEPNGKMEYPPNEVSRKAVTRGVRVKIGSLTCFLRARPLATASRLGYASRFPPKRNAVLRRIPSCAQMPPRLLRLGLGLGEPTY